MTDLASSTEELVSVAPWVQLCGNLAPLASVVGLLSPWPTVQRFRREGKVGHLPLLPYTLMIINCLFYFCYGLLVHEIRIWSSNGIGLMLGIYYFAAYLPYIHASSTDIPSPLPGTLKQHYQGLGLAVAFICSTLLLSQDPANIIGKTGMVICVSLFASPLAAIRVVLETKSSRSIPLPFTVAMTINCFLWTVFGLWQSHDPNVYIPNGLGLCFQLAQVGLKLYFVEDSMLSVANKEADHASLLP